jgi:UDP-N-acetylmuramoylalanine--D-glutamate ligase
MTHNPPDFLKPALARPVAILGGGVSGDGVHALLAGMGVEATIYDASAGKGVEFTSTAAKQHALVVYSPGFAPEHPWLKRARDAEVLCIGELDFAALFWRGKVIAITGTNGKTTLTELITHALGGIGRDAVATGNIGRSFSRVVAEKAGGRTETFGICEVSSFQAETLQHFQADATLWTNFAEDHLERHPGMESYFSAKWNLVTHTAPNAVFVGSSVQRYARKFDRPTHSVHAVLTEGQPFEPKLAQTVFAEYPQRENFLLAQAWWRTNGFDEAALYAAAGTFKLGRHRLAQIGTHDGITFWNDSKATNFHAVESALARFDAPVVLIAGGKSKGGDLGGFVHRIASRVKHAVLIGETTAELALQCATFRVAHTCCPNFPEAVRRATELADAGDHVLLSPGFASFDMFRNYEDRGSQFELLVRNLGAPAASLG